METRELQMRLWDRPDIFQTLLPRVDRQQLEAYRRPGREKAARPYFQHQRQILDALPAASALPQPLKYVLTGDTVQVGAAADLTEAQHAAVQRAIETLIPWRKGPFRLFGHEIDAEWRSNLKWDRIRPAIGSLAGQQILDIGCGNGYYMFRAAADGPRLILGIDPSIPFGYSFEMFQRYLQRPELQYEWFGHEALDLFDRDFDQIWCMGILYHYRNPLGLLHKMRQALRTRGVAIIESQTVPGSGTTALFPTDRYAKARNVYFVPTRDCLVNWVRRSGFRQVEIVSHTPVTVDEQRATECAPYESLADFLDPNDPERTVEGYPAPWRTALRAVKP